MPFVECSHDQIILDTLQSDGTLTIEELVNRVPELTWNEVFGAVDRLSRSGTITLRRRGFTYELSAPRLAVAS